MRFLAISGPGVAQDEDFCPNCHVLGSNGTITRFARRQHNTGGAGRNGVYGSGGRQRTFPCHTNALISSGGSKPPHCRHWATVAGFGGQRSRRASDPLPRSNPVICRTIETLGRTDETSPCAPSHSAHKSLGPPLASDPSRHQPTEDWYRQLRRTTGLSRVLSARVSQGCVLQF
jgi:hypothetical protein